VLRTDNGPECRGRAMLTWAHARGVTLRLIEPGNPNQNASIESFNARQFAECLLKAGLIKENAASQCLRWVRRLLTWPATNEPLADQMRRF